MKIRIVAARAVTGAFLILTPIAWVSAATPEKVTSPTPAELVTAALKTELDGPTEQREALLREALDRDPEFAPARWQLGFVRWDDEWLALDEVAKRASGDERLTEYRKRRDRMIDTADAHRALAIWCGKNRLNDEQRIHWAQVLEFNVQDAEALAALGLQLYNGRLLTKEQIAAVKKQAGERLRAMKHWQPRIVKWRGAIERGSGKGRTAALEALGELSDPGAIPALEATFAQDKQSAKTDELNLLLIETVGRMPFPEATQVLLRRAIVPDSRRVREAAADELKKRPMHAYVPQLIAMIPGKLQTRGQLIVAGYAVLRQEQIIFEGKDTEYYLTREKLTAPSLTFVFGHPGATDAQLALVMTRAMGREWCAILDRERRQLAALDASTKTYQQWSKRLSDRIQFALHRTTGWNNATNPRLLERQWNDYNDWYTSPYASPRRKSATTFNVELRPVVARQSCFSAGTPVLTLQGTRPIETVKSGDRVVSQNVETGELGYKTVHSTTIHSGSPLVKIKSDSETIRSTRGHPFWIVGSGWRVAKFLKPGDRLSTQNGTVCVMAVEEQPSTEVYNLVVDDWHNYFVGESRLLVHDNSPLQETFTLVPGLSIQAAAR